MVCLLSHKNAHCTGHEQSDQKVHHWHNAIVLLRSERTFRTWQKNVITWQWVSFYVFVCFVFKSEDGFWRCLTLACMLWWMSGLASCRLISMISSKVWVTGSADNPMKDDSSLSLVQAWQLAGGWLLLAWSGMINIHKYLDQWIELYFYQTHTIKVCHTCSWCCPWTSAASAPHLTATL